jgi:hypothetical protein
MSGRYIVATGPWVVFPPTAKTVDIAKVPFGTVVGGTGDWADVRLMVIGPIESSNAADCIILSGDSIGEVCGYSGDGWIVYEEGD